MAKRPFAPSIWPPWTITACAIAGAAAAWITSSRWLTIPHSMEARIVGDELAGRCFFALYFGVTHGFAAYLHGPKRPAWTMPLWTLAVSTVLPGLALGLLFALPGRPWAGAFIEPMLFGLGPALLATPAVLAIAHAEGTRAAGRAVSVLAAGLLVPWWLGEAQSFTFALVAAMSLTSLAIGLHALAAWHARVRIVGVRVVRDPACSYRSPPVLRLVARVTRDGGEREGLRQLAWTACAVALLGGANLALIAGRGPRKVSQELDLAAADADVDQRRSTWPDRYTPR